MANLQDLALPAVIGGVGYFAVRELLGKNQEYEALNKFLDKVNQDIEEELDGDISEQKIEGHITEYKTQSITLYNSLSEDRKQGLPTPGDIEEQTDGETKEDTALTWKHYAEGLAGTRQREVAGESILNDREWLIVAAFLGAAGAKAAPRLMRAMKDYWRNNPIRNRLGFASEDFADFYQDYSEIINLQEPPETFAPPESGGVQPYAEVSLEEGRELGEIEAEVITAVLQLLDIQRQAEIAISSEVASILADVTDKNQQFYLSLAGATLAIVAIAALAAAAGIAAPEPASTAAGIGILGLLGIWLGIEFNNEKLTDALPDLREETQVKET